MALILAALISYLIGAVPTAYLAGRLTKKIDIRKHGSGNVGATNAFRVLGPGVGVSVLLLDTLKGVIPVVLVSDFIIKQYPAYDSILLGIILGIVAVFGHSFTIFLKFKGGKGMATTLGVLIGLSIKLPAVKLILILELLIWIIVFLLTRIVSSASIVSAVFFPLFFIIFKQPLALIMMSLVLSIFIIIRHKSNIIRILRKEEPRLNLRKPAVN